MSSSSDANPLGVVSESTSVDPFDVYEQNDSQALAVKDFVVGKGTTVESGNLLTLKYKARFLATGKQFDESESYVCRVGKGKIIPGFDQGLMVRLVASYRVELYCIPRGQQCYSLSACEPPVSASPAAARLT